MSNEQALREALEKFSDDLDAMRGTMPRQAQEAMDYFRRSLNDILDLAATPASEPAPRNLTEHQREVEEAAGMNLDWNMANGFAVGTAQPAPSVEELRDLVKKWRQPRFVTNDGYKLEHDHDFQYGREACAGALYALLNRLGQKGQP